MGVVVTSIARVRDWQAVRELVAAARERARVVGATRYQVYRNLHDASQALVVAEFPDNAAADELEREMRGAIGLFGAAEMTDDRAWEPAGFEGIG